MFYFNEKVGSMRHLDPCSIEQFFIPWQLKIRRYLPVPKFNKLIVVFHQIESPVYVFRYLLHDWESFEAISEK